MKKGAPIVSTVNNIIEKGSAEKVTQQTEACLITGAAPLACILCSNVCTLVTLQAHLRYFLT